MSNLKLKRMQLHPTCWQALQRTKMTVSKDVLVRTKTELVQQLDMSSCSIENMIDTICKATCPQFKTAQALSVNGDARDRFMPTGLESLDLALHGGKTQFCLKACVLAMRNGGGSIFIGLLLLVPPPDPPAPALRIQRPRHTESRFSAERLCEIARTSFPEQFSDPEAQQALAGRCTVYSVTSTEQLLEVLKSLDEHHPVSKR
ncbi:hypothetical protein T484DRAFT_1810072 [Baffinella frigidus]|nr:hypothetical protein T484DRAFT_1810072 [Cryptophyta sp. CCMP2293]